MEKEMYMIEPVAHIRTDFPGKFGLPRQSGLAGGLTGRIVFSPAFRDASALRGIEGFSHLWLIWRFSLAERRGWSPTVRPPRMGGNIRMGVFATRSPFRPNSLGLSCVRLEGVEPASPDGPSLLVSGVDLADGTPILDIKPYLPFTDSHPLAAAGFAEGAMGYALEVACPPGLLEALPAEKRLPLLEALAQDPRPSYQSDPDRVYGFSYAGFEVRFSVADGVLTLREILPPADEAPPV